MFLIHFAEPAALADLKVKDIFRRGFISLQDRVLGFAIAILHGKLSYAEFGAKIAQPGGDGRYVRQVTHGLSVVIRKLFTRAHLLGRAAEGKRLDMKRKYNVGADTGDHSAHIIIEAVANGGDGNDHGHSDHDAEHGERRA